MGLRNAARGFGQALTFLGQQGLEDQRRREADQRLLDRQMAFERFQQGIRREDAVEGDQREEKQYARSTPLVVEREAATLDAREPFREREDRRTLERETARAEREESQEARRDSRELRQEIARENRAAAREEARERREARRRGDAITDRYVNQDDQRVLVTASGQEIVLQNRVRPTASGDPLGLDQDQDQEETRQTGDSARQPPRSRPTANSYTEDDVLVAMRNHRLTRPEAIRQIEARGYRRAQ